MLSQSKGHRTVTQRLKGRFTDAFGSSLREPGPIKQACFLANSRFYWLHDCLKRKNTSIWEVIHLNGFNRASCSICWPWLHKLPALPASIQEAPGKANQRLEVEVEIQPLDGIGGTWEPSAAQTWRQFLKNVCSCLVQHFLSHTGLLHDDISPIQPVWWGRRRRSECDRRIEASGYEWLKGKKMRVCRPENTEDHTPS